MANPVADPMRSATDFRAWPCVSQRGRVDEGHCRLCSVRKIV